MTLSVFRDAERDARYQADGFLTFPLLSPDELTSVVGGYRPDERCDGFHTTLYSQSAPYRGEMDALIAGAVDARLEPLLSDYRVAIRQFAVKRPHDPTGVVGPHQDWSITDETQYEPLVVWIALADVDVQTGALWMVPGSHRIAPGVRTNSSKADYYCPLQDVARELQRQHARFIPLRAGEAVAYHPATVHGSEVHRGDTDRLAAIVGCLPRTAPCYHYFRSQRSHVDVYDIGDRFFIENVRLQEPPIGLTPARCYVSEPAPLTMQQVGTRWRSAP